MRARRRMSIATDSTFPFLEKHNWFPDRDGGRDKNKDCGAGLERGAHNLHFGAGDVDKDSNLGLHPQLRVHSQGNILN